ncbi:MAG: GNAT family N-acetyltransferase [Alphaproteobacteria bacterium]
MPNVVTISRQTIFDEDWWLDAAAPGEWDRAQVVWNATTVGEMAFHVRRRWGLTYIKMPHLTRTMSPRLFPPAGKPVNQTIDNQAIVVELVGKLPKYDRLELSLNPGCPSVQGFVHANLAVTHMFTFRSEAGLGPEAMLKQAHAETRRIIGKAQRECLVERDADLDRFIKLHRQSYGETNLVDYSILERLFGAAAAHGQAEILFARHQGGPDTAAMILLQDQRTTYTWLSARNIEQKYRGASSLLVFEAMRSSHERGSILDLDGYVRPEVGSFMMKFGLQAVTRPYVNGSSPVWQCFRAATTLMNSKREDRHFRVP